MIHLPPRRRPGPWLWVVFAVGGFAVVVWRAWTALDLGGQVTTDLETLDQLSSVASLWVGVLSLLVGISGMVLPVFRPHRTGLPSSGASAGGSVPASPVGLASLTVPNETGHGQVLGRDQMITELAGLFRWRSSASRVHVLHGMGGSGKTAVAAQVARRLLARGVVVWWVSAADSTGLDTGMRQLARVLQVPESELTFDGVWQRLATYPRRWLLVIDNADDPRLLVPVNEAVAAGRGWVRPINNRQGAILVTSRDGTPETWGAWCQLHQVGMLPRQVSVRVLQNHTRGHAGTDEEAGLLAQRLGDLPLALRMAGRYLADATHTPVPDAITTCNAYRIALDTKGVSAVFDDHESLDGDGRVRTVISRTWEVTLDLLDSQGMPEARQLLRLLSLFADAPIPYRLLDPTMMAGSPLFPDLTVIRLQRVLGTLVRLGLLDQEDGEPGSGRGGPIAVRMHPLIRDTSRHHLHTSGRSGSALALAARLLARTAAGLGDNDDATTWPRWHLLAPHPPQLVSAAARSSPPAPSVVRDAATAALECLYYLSATGLYQTALDRTRELYETVSGVLGPEDSLTLDICDLLARSTGLAGDLAGSRDRYAALLPVREGVSGPDHPDTLTTRHNLAQSTGLAGDAATARDRFAELLPASVLVLGPEHPDTLDTRHCLARWTGEAGDPTTARQQFADLLSLRITVLGPEHPNTLATRHHLARWTGEAGDPTTARQQFTDLLPLRTRVLGPEHPDTLATRYCLARWTGEAGDPTTARQQFTDLLLLQMRIIGPEHPDTQATLARLDRCRG
jgi:hypothetical protein